MLSVVRPGFARSFLLLCWIPLLGLGLTACSRHTSPAAASTSHSAAGTNAAAGGCLPTHDGYLKARVRGAANLDIDWHDADMQCDGGPRPDGHGIRVTFAGSSGTSTRLRFVFGIGVTPTTDAASESPTNITVIFEGENRLYSTHGDAHCTVDEMHATPLPKAPSSQGTLRRVSARGFCVANADAVGGSGPGLLISRFDFAGAVFDEDRSGS